MKTITIFGKGNMGTAIGDCLKMREIRYLI